MEKFFLIILLTAVCSAASAATWLEKADSLFTARQYTQALEHYQGIFKSGQYSPAMLLKMAYIEEGLNHLGGSLYYLNLYFLSTGDQQTLKKMEEVAEKNNLKGYENDETQRAFAWLHDKYDLLSMAIAAFGVFLLVILYIRLARKRPAGFAGGVFILTMIFLFIQVNFSDKSERGIVINPQTYLMSGPSAGATVVDIIGEGHQLVIDGRQDVWLKVTWNDQQVYVRENLVQPVRL